MKRTFKVSTQLPDNAYWCFDEESVTVTYQSERELTAILAVLSRLDVQSDAIVAPSNDFQLPGYETLELSTQNMIAVVIKYGINYQVLDEHIQIIKLTYGTQVE